ncbi:MAG: hypothetical protein HRU07_06650 [Nitrosopumilus sp.]|nr:hypothetical protein [Nitrosopumilus sp.]NRA05820.1 hypothetical protein [Nitrosopumilus sp.]
MITKEVDSISDVEEIEFSINNVELLKKDFAISALSTIVNVEMIDVMAEKMRSAGYSNKIIHSTYLKEITINGDNEAEIYIVSDYTEESGYPVADGREY